MRIVVATPWFPNTRRGWPGRFVSDSALSLAGAGARVSVSVVRGWVPPPLSRFAPPEHRGEIERGEFAALEALRLRRCVWLPGAFFRPLTNRSVDRAVAAGIEAAGGADVIHAHTEGMAPAALRVARQYGIPLVVTLHGENTNARLMKAPAQTRRFRDALSGADRLVIVGEPLRPYAEALSGRKEGIVTVWNGVDAPTAAVPAPVRGADTGPLRLVCTANLQEGKGVDLLIDALAGLGEGGGDWVLTIIGEGPQRAALMRRVEGAGLTARVVFAGAVDNAAVFDHLRGADVFVLPSYREAFGIAYVEAMASGLLTIGVEGQGPSGFIDHGKTGFLVPPRDTAALRALLRCILSDRDREWRRIAAAGQAFARHSCTWNAHARRLIGVFSEAIDARSGDR